MQHLIIGEGMLKNSVPVPYTHNHTPCTRGAILHRVRPLYKSLSRALLYIGNSEMRMICHDNGIIDYDYVVGPNELSLE
jgi:hypothetical protein